MDTMLGFARAMANAGRPMMVFDWEKAARLIVERNAKTASAGLEGDWEWTGGEIWADGKPVPKEDTYTYLASNHATPELEIDGERMDCMRTMDETPGWDSGTYWPPEALAIVAPNIEVKPRPDA